jgi:hypothetical protein
MRFVQLRTPALRRLIGVLPVVLALSCGGSTEDPYANKCKTACQVDATHPCALKTEGGAKVSDTCVANCMALANLAQKNATGNRGPGCGDCIVSTFSYSLKPSCTTGAECCYGVLNKSPGDAECSGKCFEPDGSI